jgi:hypothetical protein
MMTGSSVIAAHPVEEPDHNLSSPQSAVSISQPMAIHSLLPTKKIGRQIESVEQIHQVA